MTVKVINSNDLQNVMNSNNAQIKARFVAKEEGKGLSTEDFSTAEKTKLSGLPTAVNGVLPIESIPPSAIERMTKVANSAARLALTSSSVQNGDTVKELDTGLMYMVVDDTKLGTENVEQAFEAYTAGSASSVPWSGVTNKPSEYTPENHASSKVTAMTSYSKPQSLTGGQEAIAVGDSLNTAVGKLEYKVDAAQSSIDNLDTTNLTSSEISGIIDAAWADPQEQSGGSGEGE